MPSRGLPVDGQQCAVPDMSRGPTYILRVLRSIVSKTLGGGGVGWGDLQQAWWTAGSVQQ